MKNKDSVELIEYTKAQDALNCVTHALGAIFGAAVLILLIKKAAPFSSARYMASAIVYGLFDYFALRRVGSLSRLAAGRSKADSPSCRSLRYTDFARRHGDPVLAHNAL